MSNIHIATEFIEAFYSFDQKRLLNLLSYAEESHGNILYYQKWAECGNYKVIKKHDWIIKSESLILCPITVEDDLMSALNIDFHVTDTFHISFQDNKIQSVETSSDDPDLYYQAKEWVSKNRPELIQIPCKGIWDGGPTPCACIKAMIQGFRAFNKNR